MAGVWSKRSRSPVDAFLPPASERLRPKLPTVLSIEAFRRSAGCTGYQLLSERRYSVVGSNPEPSRLICLTCLHRRVSRSRGRSSGGLRANAFSESGIRPVLAEPCETCYALEPQRKGRPGARLSSDAPAAEATAAGRAAHWLGAVTGGPQVYVGGSALQLHQPPRTAFTEALVRAWYGSAARSSARCDGLGP